MAHRLFKLTFALLMSLVMLAGLSASATAGTYTTPMRNKNCSTQTAELKSRATFHNPVTLYGKGRYQIKRWIKWDMPNNAGGWTNYDRAYLQTDWLQINNPSYDYGSFIYDKTNWGNLYEAPWRAHVTFKLIKNRIGPRDKMVEQVDYALGPDSFFEKGSYCGVDF